MSAKSILLANGRSVTNFEHLGQVLAFRAQAQPNREAFTFLENGEEDASSITYSELAIKVNNLAASLQARNLQGQRALLLFPPSLEYIIAFLGCLQAGVTAVPLYVPMPNQSVTRVQSVIQDAQASIVLTNTMLLAYLQGRFAELDAMKHLQWLACDTIAENPDLSIDIEGIKKEDIAFLQYTSGSTATPKGVMVSHANIMHNSQLIYESFGHTPESRGVIWLPPYHDMGLIGGILQPLYAGFPVTLMSPLSFIRKPLRWLKAISKYKATTSGGPNFCYDLCIRKTTPEQRANLDLSSWKIAFNGSETIRKNTLDRFTEAFAVSGFKKSAFFPCYGMAESTLIISGTSKIETLQVNEASLKQHQINSQNADYELVSCGPVLGGQKMIIVHPESLQKCTSNEVGEIWIAGDSVTKGYWNQAEKTKESYEAFVQDTGEGPFFRTGDLGFIKEGNCYITGRMKDMIIIRGCNYYPQDVELSAAKSHEALQESAGAAFAITVDGNEKLVLVQEVKKAFQYTLNANDFEAIFKKIRQAVAHNHHVQVHDIVLIKARSIPRTSSGKIKRYLCRECFLNGDLSVLSQMSVKVATA